MSWIMATDYDGDRYVAERTIGDATVRVLTGTIIKRRTGSGVAYWEQATYAVRGPGGVVGDDIILRANGTFDVPGKAQRVGLGQAVAIALGREEPPPFPSESEAELPRIARIPYKMSRSRHVTREREAELT